MNRRIKAPVDRTSKLPKELLHHILSFLPTKKEVYRTSILSKSWGRACAILPVLVFDINRRRKGKPRGRAGQVYLDFVEQKLRRCFEQKISISRLELYFPHYRDDLKFYLLLDQCIIYALKSNVRELILHYFVRECDWYDMYTLPPTIWAAKSVTLLSLEGFIWSFQSPCSNLKLSLKKLFLSDVSMDDQVFQNLIDNSPGLEELSLSCCSGLKNLKISGPLKLKKISIVGGSYQTVEIQAYHLESLIYMHRVIPHMLSCKNMKRLELFSDPVTEQCLHDFLREFPSLEVLALAGCHMLERVEVPHHSLKEFSLDCCEMLKSVQISAYSLKKLSLRNCEKLVELEIDTPNLLSFSYSGPKTTSLSSNAMTLMEAILCLYPENIRTDWYVGVAEFLRKLDAIDAKILIIPKRSREAWLLPLHDIKHLALHTSNLKNLVEVVEGLLWISPYPETVSIRIELGKKSQFLKNSVERREDDPYWRYCLKEVKYEKFIPVEYIKNVKELKENVKFFLEIAKMVEKIDGLTDCDS